MRLDLVEDKESELTWDTLSPPYPQKSREKSIQKVLVAFGNREAMGFYECYGFVRDQ